jgi:ornithine carbamoyltransferase
MHNYAYSRKEATGLAVMAPQIPARWPVLYGRDVLRLNDFSADELTRLVDLARTLKQLRQLPVSFEPLRGRTLATVFEKPSTRTRVSFAVGMQQLGGQVLELAPATLQLARGESLEDTARVLSRYVDAVMVRTGPQERLEILAEHATIPIINGLSDAFHPCQLLADLLTLAEHFGTLNGLVVSYVGDGSNMAASWMEAAAILGLGLRLAVPPGYEPPEPLMAWASAAAAAAGGGVSLTHDPREAVLGADVVYTDVWVSMGQEEMAAQRQRDFAPYQVNRLLMQQAGSDTLFMHCLPAHRGQEVTADVIDGPQSVVWEEAENRLHAQKALLLSVMAEPSP